MAASMWRMNGLCRKMAGLLVLCTLLLSGAVICQEQASDSPDATAATGNVTVDSTAALQNASVAPSVGGGQSNVNSGLGPSLTTITVNVIPEITASVNVIPEIIASDDAGDNVLPAEASSDVKTSKESTESPSSSDSSVFVGVLVSGLLAALGITAGYFYCQRRTDTKGIKLTDEAYPADQENQGSTLASVAPLNPPPETQEKPSVNGESPEAAKTQPPPPNNGHSTTKTADTEL